MMIVSVLQQEEGGIGKSIPDARDFPRAKPEENLEGRGKSRDRRGWISQYLPSFGGNSFIVNLSTMSGSGVDADGKRISFKMMLNTFQCVSKMDQNF